MPQEHPSHQQSPPGTVLCGFLLGAFLIRMVGLWRGLWVDEVTTWVMINHPPWEMVRLRFVTGHMPLYFILEKLCMKFMPATDWAMRSLSLLCSLLQFALVLRIGWRVSQRVALMAAVLLLLHPADLWMAQTARPYAMQALLMTAASWLLLQQLRRPSFKTGLLLALATAAGILTHIFYVPFVCCQGIFLLWELRRDTLKAWRLYLPIAAGVLMAMPGIISLLALQIQTGELRAEAFNWKPFVDILGAFVAGDYYRFGFNHKFRLVVMAIGLVTGCLLGARLIAKKEYLPVKSLDEAGRLLRYTITWVIGFTVFVGFLMVAGKNEVGAIRYYLTHVPGVVLLFALIADIIERWWLRYAYAGLLLLTMLPVATKWFANQGDGLRPAAEALESSHKNAEPIIVCEGETTREGLLFYMKGPVRENLVPVSRAKNDPEELATEILPHLSGADHVWLVLYHAEDSPLRQVLQALGATPEAPPETFGEVELQYLAIK